MEAINNLKLNIWKKHSIASGYRTLEQIYNGIKNGSVKDLVIKIRNAQNENEKALLKKQSYSFTVSGIFKEKRRIEDLEIYTRLIVLDIDHLQSERVNEIAEKAKAIDYSTMVFISPSGFGVKIIVAIDSTKEQHENAYAQVTNYYQNKLGVEFDRKTKDITRLCYMSYDENAYYEPDAKIFHFDLSEPELVVLKESPIDMNFGKKIAYINYKIEQKGTFINGNRNNYIHNFACLANRLGMNKSVLTEYLISRYIRSDFSNDEIITTIESSYKNIREFGIYNYPSFATDSIKQKNEVIPKENNEISEAVVKLLNSPLIKDFVKENLHKFM